MLSRALPLMAFALLVACDRQAPPPEQESPAAAPAATAGEIDRSRAGELLPAVALTNPDGAGADLAAMQGEPLLVNLWATWCAPCVKEMPLLDELAADTDGRLRVVTISQDFEPARVPAFFAERELANLPRWLDPANAAMAAFEANSLPLTVLYDAEGREVWRVAGDYDWASAPARAAVKEAL